jgi:hypothetical protein
VYQNGVRRNHHAKVLVRSGVLMVFVWMLKKYKEKRKKKKGKRKRKKREQKSIK